MAASAALPEICKYFPDSDPCQPVEVVEEVRVFYRPALDEQAVRKAEYWILGTIIFDLLTALLTLLRYRTQDWRAGVSTTDFYNDSIVANIYGGINFWRFSNLVLSHGKIILYTFLLLFTGLHYGGVL